MKALFLLSFLVYSWFDVICANVKPTIIALSTDLSLCRCVYGQSFVLLSYKNFRTFPPLPTTTPYSIIVASTHFYVGTGFSICDGRSSTETFARLICYLCLAVAFLLVVVYAIRSQYYNMYLSSNTKKMLYSYVNHRNAHTPVSRFPESP